MQAKRAEDPLSCHQLVSKMHVFPGQIVTEVRQGFAERSSANRAGLSLAGMSLSRLLQ